MEKYGEEKRYKWRKRKESKAKVKKRDGKNNRGEKDRCEEKQKGRKIWLGKDRGRERRVENGTGEKRR